MKFLKQRRLDISKNSKNIDCQSIFALLFQSFDKYIKACGVYFVRPNIEGGLYCMQHYILTTTSLTKNFKNETALDNVSIHIPAGTIYGLVGNNGAGKTTLMRLVLGLQSPTTGLINKDDSIRIGAIVENPAFYPYWSAKRNIKYHLSLAKNPKYTATELLDMVGLKDIPKPVLQYSLGMKQRLGLALALANNPHFLILDEPLNGLDPSGILQMRALLQNLCKEQLITVLISSHILDELQKIVTHVGILQNGTLICECAIGEIPNESLEKYYFETLGKGEIDDV